MSFVTRPLSKAIGAEILEIELSATVDRDAFSKIEKIFNENTVVVIRGQTMTPKSLIDFGKRFGELEINVMNQYALPEYPEVLVISNIVQDGRRIGLADAGRNWHTDMSYMPTPPRCSLLYAVKVPEENGRPLGNTMFVSTAAAYDDLPVSTKKKLNGLRAVHRSSARIRFDDSRSKAAKNQGNQLPDVIHPVVRTHPITGRKSLYVREGECVGIVGMPDDEALMLIKELSDFCIRPDFMYSHQWRVGDVLMWDNCTAQHLAVKDYELPQERLMHRVTVNGSRPF